MLGAKFTLRPSLTFSYIGSVATAHSSSGRQPNLVAWYTRNRITEVSKRVPPISGWAAITFGIGEHSSVILYWQHYCTALQQWASAKLCGVVHGMELRNFRRGRHLYSAGGHHVGHRPTFSLSIHQCSFLPRCVGPQYRLTSAPTCMANFGTAEVTPYRVPRLRAQKLI